MWGYLSWGWFFVGALMFLTVMSIIAIAPGGGKRTPTPDEKNLQERYGHGEISNQEYGRRMGDLRRAA
jgi:uncharacterized membrane protein